MLSSSYLAALEAEAKQRRIDQPWVLITGSTRGLGKELALAFARAEFNIILHDTGRDSAAGKEMEKRLEELKSHSILVHGDLAEAQTIMKLIAEAQERNILVLVNNA